jgi:hypothetical protein
MRGENSGGNERAIRAFHVHKSQSLVYRKVFHQTCTLYFFNKRKSLEINEGKSFLLHEVDGGHQQVTFDALTASTTCH